MLDDSCPQLRSDAEALLLGLFEQGDDSSGHRVRVIVVHENGMAPDEFRNRTATTDHHRGFTAHSFGDDHAKCFGVTDLHIDFGPLQPTHDVRVGHGADEINAGLNAEIGSERAYSMVCVALYADNDEFLLRKNFENGGDGTQEDVTALETDDVVVEVEDGGDVRPGIVRWAECLGINAIWNDDGITSAQLLRVVNHEVGDDQNNCAEAQTKPSSKFFVPRCREITSRNTRQGVGIEHRVVAASDYNDRLVRQSSFDERQNAPAGPPGEVEIAAPRNL